MRLSAEAPPPVTEQFNEFERSRIHLASDAEFEPEAQLLHRRWLGELATGGMERSTPKVNLLERLKAAREGSEEAKAWLEINVNTAIFEAVFKEGYVGETFMDRQANGELVQFGQSNDSVHSNAMSLRPNRHPILKGITEAESLNRQRIEVALNNGKLKDHHYVIFSLVPNGVPETQLGSQGDGYFLDSLTMSIQATTEVPNGQVKTEVGFMPGVVSDGVDKFEERLAKRYDFQALAKLYSWFGQQAPQTAKEGIEKGLFIPKEAMPNGVPDVMRLMDMAADEVLWRQVDRKIEDYIALKQGSRRKEASLKDVRKKVLTDLLASVDDFEQPIDAVQRLWELVRQHALEESFVNPLIDPRVFGREASPDIIMVRYHLQNGDPQRALYHKERAYENAEVTGCGGGGGKRNKHGSSEEDEDDLLSSSEEEDEYGTLEFECTEGHKNRRPRHEKITECCVKNCKGTVGC